MQYQKACSLKELCEANCLERILEMNIKKLSDISGVKSETIRLYRKLGFLHPSQNASNHYYDYSREDLLNLLYIKKLRGSGLSLNAIGYTYEHSHIEDVLGSYHKELEEIDRQIEILRQRRFALAMTLNHLEEYRWNASGVTEIESMDEKLDCYFDEHYDDPDFVCWIQNAVFFTQTLGLKKEQLICPDEMPDYLPVKVGLGTYRNILQEQKIVLPEKHTSCPPGRYVTARVELAELGIIEKEQLMPMMQYIHEKGLQVDSDTTAFLYRIDYNREQPVFIFRLRVKVTERTI